MKRFTVILNGVGCIFFIVFLIYTCFARDHFDSKARAFVTEKTVVYSEPLVDIAETALEIPLVEKLLGKERLKVYRGEIESYRENAVQYVTDLIRLESNREEKPLPGNPVLAGVVKLKQKIRKYYAETLDALILDLRIFATSNLCACIFALALAILSSEKVRPELLLFSVGIFLLMIYSSWLYIDGLGFFRILFQAHLGWWYPGILTVSIILMFCFHYGSHLSDSPGTGDESSADNLAD